MKNDSNFKELRSNVLYSQDKTSKIRKSHKNPEMIAMYEDYINKEKERAHHLFHTTYKNRKDV
ncbi:MAG: iron hydrogenase small subunit [Fusobacteriaceae bacterium]